jgi:hypothetical protein
MLKTKTHGTWQNLIYDVGSPDLNQWYERETKETKGSWLIQKDPGNGILINTIIKLSLQRNIRFLS